MPIQSLAWFPDDTRIATASWDQTICVWDAASGELLCQTMKLGGFVTCLAVSPDCRTLFAGVGSRIHMIDAISGHVVSQSCYNNGEGICIAISRDARFAAFVVSITKLEVCSLEKRSQVALLEGHRNGISCASFSPDGKRLVSGTCGSKTKGRAAIAERMRRNDCLIIWDLATSQPESYLGGHRRWCGVGALTFTNDGQFVISGGGSDPPRRFDDTIRVWNVANGRQRSVLRGNDSAIRSLAVSQDNEYVACGLAFTGTVASAGGGHQFATVRIWHLPRRRQASVLTGHAPPVNAVAFSADGTSVASGSQDGTVRIWYTADGRPQSRLKGTGRNWSQTTFSADGALIAAGGWRTVAVWDAVTGLLRHHIFAFRYGITGVQRKWVTSVAFTPSSRCIVSGSAIDKSILVSACAGNLFAPFLSETLASIPSETEEMQPGMSSRFSFAARGTEADGMRSQIPRPANLGSLGSHAACWFHQRSHDSFL